MVVRRREKKRWVMERCYRDRGLFQRWRDVGVAERGAHFKAHVPHARSACARMYWKTEFVWFALMLPEAYKTSQYSD